MSNTIWRTVECDAWSRGFDYQSYLMLHSRSSVTSNAVSEATYHALSIAFEIEMSIQFT